MKIKHISWFFFAIAMTSIVMMGYLHGSWLWFTVLLSSAITCFAVSLINEKRMDEALFSTKFQ